MMPDTLDVLAKWRATVTRDKKVLLIGLAPPLFLLLERLVNLVHENAPGAKL
jgi:hypothetical protein